MEWQGARRYAPCTIRGRSLVAAAEVAREAATLALVGSAGIAVIETPMGERLFGAEEIKKFSLGLHPIGRFGRPMEVAEAVLWMCSERASFMTGQSLILDGGFLAGPNVPG